MEKLLIWSAVILLGYFLVQAIINYGINRYWAGWHNALDFERRNNKDERDE